MPPRPFRTLKNVLRASVPAIVLAACASSTSEGADVFDILITGGEVYSGGLESAVVTDVGIKGDRIAFVGDAAAAGKSATTVIDAAGKMVTPGFIDAHTHAAGELASDDRSKRLVLRQLKQGVTTNIIGVDGGGSPDIADLIAKAKVDGIGGNFAAYVGFGAIRELVIGRDARPPTASELDQMKALAAKGMCEGGLGVSSGLFYAPQSFASTEEVIAVVSEAGKRGGIYDTHQRDEGTTSIGVVASTREQIRISQESGAPLHLGHFKVSSGAKPNGESMKELLAIIDEARAKGLTITSDQYPWTASSTGLVALAIPRWAQDGGREAMLKRFDNPADLARIEAESTAFYAERGGAQNILIHSAEGQPELVGKRVSEIAEAWGITPAQASVRILQKGSASVAVFAITEPDMRLLMTQPWNMASSDGSPSGHPRGHATYPMFFTKYVLDEKVLTPVEFVHKSSGLVADSLGISERGYLKPGYFADIAVIDAANFKPKATYVDPVQLSEGVDYVLVNGKLTLNKGEPTGVLAGLGLAKTPPAGVCP